VRCWGVGLLGLGGRDSRAGFWGVGVGGADEGRSLGAGLGLAGRAVGRGDRAVVCQLGRVS